MVEAVKTHHRKRKRQSRRRWVAGLLLVCFALAGVVLVIAIRNAEPILQARIVETLSTRFHITQSLSQWPTDEIEDEKPREDQPYSVGIKRVHGMKRGSSQRP